MYMTSLAPVKRSPKVVRKERALELNAPYHYYHFVTPTSKKLQALNIVLSKIWLQRGLSSNRSLKCWGRRPHFPFGGLLTIAAILRWILQVLQWLMWPVFQFPGQVQQPNNVRYLQFLCQVGKRCACKFIVLGDFVGRCLVRRCTCLCGSVASVWFCIRVWTVISQAIGLSLDHGISMLLVLSRRFPFCRIKFAGSSVTGIFARFTALHRISFIELCRCCVSKLLRLKSPVAELGFLEQVTLGTRRELRGLTIITARGA